MDDTTREEKGIGMKRRQGKMREALKGKEEERNRGGKGKERER